MKRPSSLRGSVSRARAAGPIQGTRRGAIGRSQRLNRSVGPAGVAADRAGRDLRDRIDLEVGGAAIGAAVGATGGVGAAAHPAHRHGSTGHRCGGGSRHHVRSLFLSGSRVSRAPALSAICARRGAAALTVRSRTARCREPERNAFLGPGRQGSQAGSTGGRHIDGRIRQHDLARQTKTEPGSGSGPHPYPLTPGGRFDSAAATRPPPRHGGAR